MRKIRIIEHIPLDGVIQAPGRRDEDGDYAHGGWTALNRSAAGREAVAEAQGSSFDLLLGRRTYDIWNGYWPAGKNEHLSTLWIAANRMNLMPSNQALQRIRREYRDCNPRVPRAGSLSLDRRRQIHMESHELSRDDCNFRSAFESCAVTPSQFNHEAHVRLAYVYLVESDVEPAVQRMRGALLNFLEHHGIPRSKFHETITRAWVLAVRHFMNRSSSASFADFIANNQELLDSKIMLTHYSASVLFSSDARASFVEPDLDPIPQNAKPPPKDAT